MRSKKSGRWPIRFEKCLHENPYFSVLQQAVTMPDGVRAKFFTLEFQTPAVGIVAVHKGKVLLIRQYRVIVDEYVWAIPSGGTHSGEAPRAAAARELEEETGYRARDIKRMHGIYASYGCSNQIFDIFFTDNVEPSGRTFDGNEVMEVRGFSRKELQQMIARNGIVDGLSLAPLLLYLAHGAAWSRRLKARRLVPRLARAAKSGASAALEHRREGTESRRSEFQS